MKLLLSLFILLFAFSVLALDRLTADVLLAHKGTSLAQEEARGRMFMGETTGHGFIDPDKVDAFFTQNEAFLKKEVSATNLAPNGTIQGFQVGAQHFSQNEISALLIKK